MLVCLLLIAGVLQDFDHEVRFNANLRGRGLYRLAELHCLDLLEKSDLAPNQRVEATIQLSKTLVAKALDTRPPKQAQLWSKAIDLLNDSLVKQTDSTSKILLQTQLALTTQQRAEWARRTAEVQATTEDDWLPARTLIREAIKQLKMVESLLNQPRVRAGGEGLSAIRVAELLRNARHQLARAYLNQAITYASRPKDRISSLTRALQILQPIASDTAIDELVWESRIDRIQCYRLRGDIERANQLLSEAEGIPESQLGRLAAEGVRLALDAKQPVAALSFLKSLKVKRSYPALDLARIETFVALAQQAKKPNEAKPHQEKAAQLTATLTRDHGTYWGLRADMLIERFASSETSDAKLMDSVARSKLKRNLPNEAIDTFDRAAEQAISTNDQNRAFESSYNAATVEHQEGNLQPAIDRFGALARNFPTHPKSSEAHLLAVFDAAALYQQYARANVSQSASKALTQYESLLKEHLQLFPEQASSNQARIWFGRLSEAKRDWDSAIQAYRSVTPQSKHARDAYVRLGNAYITRFANKKEAAEEVDQAKQWFQQQLADVGDAETQRILREQIVRLATQLAPQDYAMAMTALNALPKDELAASQPLQVATVIALAGTNELQQARFTLTKASPLPKDALVELLQGLQPILDKRPDNQGVVALANEVIGLLQAHNTTLQPEVHLLIKQIQADSSDGQTALRIYQKLAADHPEDERIQWRFAELISQGRDRESRTAALKQWRLLVRKSKPQSSNWFRAKLGVAQTHFNKGEHDKAKEIVELLMTLYPDLSSPDLKADFQRLLARCNT